MLTVVLAVAAALANALASVLQRKGARREPGERSLSVRMVWDLAHQPPWLAGAGFMLAGFVLQVAALSTGPISMVQPILAAELGFVLVLSNFLLHARLHRREWTTVLGMNTGIVLLLVGLRPTGGSSRAVTGPTWLLGCVVTVAVLVALVLVAHRHRYALRAAYLGVASGMSFGFLAVLVAGVTGTFSGGVVAVLGAWQTWAVPVAGPAAFVLLQTTLRAGSLVASQPGLILANPVVGIGWGIAVFGEEVRAGGWIVVQLAGFVLLTCCTFLLTRAPSLHGAAGAYEESDTPGSETPGSDPPTSAAPDSDSGTDDPGPGRSRSSH